MADVKGASQKGRFLVVIEHEDPYDQAYVAWHEGKTAREAAEKLLDGSIREGDTVYVVAQGNVLQFNREDMAVLVEMKAK